MREIVVTSLDDKDPWLWVVGLVSELGTQNYLPCSRILLYLFSTQSEHSISSQNVVHLYLKLLGYFYSFDLVQRLCQNRFSRSTRLHAEMFSFSS